MGCISLSLDIFIRDCRVNRWWGWSWLVDIAETHSTRGDTLVLLFILREWVASLVFASMSLCLWCALSGIHCSYHCLFLLCWYITELINMSQSVGDIRGRLTELRFTLPLSSMLHWTCSWHVVWGFKLLIVLVADWELRVLAYLHREHFVFEFLQEVWGRGVGHGTKIVLHSLFYVAKDAVKVTGVVEVLVFRGIVQRAGYSSIVRFV